MVKIIHKGNKNARKIAINIFFIASPFIPFRIVFFNEYYNTNMYKKTEWKARKGSDLNRFEKSQETERFVTLENKPNSVTEHGTPFSTANMNKIEDGIFEAHEMIAAEEQARIDGDQETLATAKEYTDAAQLATQTWLPAVETVAAFDEITGLNNNINYLCRVIKDPDNSKNGVYQCVAGWADVPVWTFFSDNADWIDETELAEAVDSAIDEHNINHAAHQNIQDDIEREANTRANAISTEAITRNQAITEEVQTRTAADNTLQGNINNTNNDIQNLRYDFNAWVGRGGYLEAYDFGTYSPTQSQLTNQALAQISTINDPSQIWNCTKIVNLANNYLWVLTNTPNTDPPIFEWTNQGTSDLTPFMADRGGYIVGANQNDPPEFVQAQLNGKGKINLEAIMELVEERLFFIEHHVGDVVVQHPGSLSPIDKQWRGLWVNWTSRASAYRLRTSALPLSNGGEPNNSNKYTQGANYSNGAYVWWQLVTESGKDDYVLLQANQAITNAAEQPDPVKWNNIRTGVLVWRKDMLDVNPWTDADLTLGQQIVRNGVNYWIEEIIVYGGKYFAAAGGNRPPFETGTAGDTIRNIIGTFYAHAGIGSGNPPTSGVFSFSNADNGGANTGAADRRGYYRFDASTVVPTGKENGVRTLTEVYWRLINRQ
jgi:hypothetical protein